VPDVSRLEYLERQVEEHAMNWDRLSGRIDALDQKLDRRFEAIDKKIDSLGGELSKQFRWTFSTMLALLGMLMTIGAAVATALLRT